MIASLPLKDAQGGVVSMCVAAGDLLKARGWVPHFICNTARGDSKDRTVLDLLRGRWRLEREKFVFAGAPAVEIGRRFPLFEPLHYLANAMEWNKVASDFPLLQVVSGSNHAGLAFALSGRRFVCWIATPYDEDKLARRQEWPAPRRFADRLVITPLCRLVEQYVYRKASLVFVLSTYTAKILARRFKLPESSLVVLPCPIDTEVFCPPVDPPHGRIVLFAARYEDPRKNTPLLLRAFARTLRAVPDARLELVGGTPTLGLIQQAADLGISGAISWHGPTPPSAMHAFYQRATVFAQPALQEGLGIVGLEAMASGLPVVSTRCGGPEDYVEPGRTGYLVDQDDEVAMSGHLVDLLTDQQLRDELGSNARSAILDRYSTDAFARRFYEAVRVVQPELA